MIYTSYFAKYRGRNGVSIARTQPTTYPEYPDLMPSWYLLKDYKNNNIDEAEYEHEYYRDVLSHLDPAKVAADLNGKVLLCWERPENFCHRHIVAEWLNKHGYLVEELTGSRERIISGRLGEMTLSHGCHYQNHTRKEQTNEQKHRNDNDS